MQWWIQLSEVLRNLGLVVAGGAGLYLAWLRVTATNRQAEAQTRQAETAISQAELSRREHVAERVNRAIGQLADPKLEVRLGAVYSLREIVQDFPERAHAVVEMLSAYLRENPRDYGDRPPPVDVREIMKLVHRRTEETND